MPLNGAYQCLVGQQEKNSKVLAKANFLRGLGFFSFSLSPKAKKRKEFREVFSLIFFANGSFKKCFIYRVGQLLRANCHFKKYN